MTILPVVSAVPIASTIASMATSVYNGRSVKNSGKNEFFMYRNIQLTDSELILLSKFLEQNIAHSEEKDKINLHILWRLFKRFSVNEEK